MHRHRPSTTHSRRWLILAVIGMAQLMVVLDATIVNIALPSAQQSLGFSDDARQWVVTAYALAFGGLLLLGGRLGDVFGRKRMFIVGLVGFAVRVGARRPRAELRRARRRPRAAGRVRRAARPGRAVAADHDLHRAHASARRHSACSARSPAPAPPSACSLGGVLTEYLTWRWCLYVNLLFAVPAAARRRSGCCPTTRSVAASTASTSPAR